jgi:phage recombination protein Bet
MSKELTLSNPESGLSIHFTPDKIQLLKNTVAKGATDTELEHFIYLAQRYNLDPFTNEIWFIKRAKKYPDNNGKWNYRYLPNGGGIDYTGAETVIMTSRDGYLKIGQADENFKELNSMEIRANDDFSYDPMTKEIQHKIGANRGAITGAWAICSRKDREPAVIIVDYLEYKTAVGKSSIWDKYPSAMIRKVAEVIVLKRQFNISGLVTREEMAEQYSYNPEPERKDITPEPEKIQQQPKENSNVIPLPIKDPKPSQEEINAEWKKYSHKINEKREMLALSPDKLKDLLLKTLGLNEDPKKWTLKEIKSAYVFLNDLSKPATYGLDKKEAEEIDKLFPLPTAKLDNDIKETHEEKQVSFNLISNYN